VGSVEVKLWKTVEEEERGRRKKISKKLITF